MAKQHMPSSDANRIREFPVPFEEGEFYQVDTSEGKQFMTEYSEHAGYYGGNRDDYPLRSLTLLNKRVNFVNPLYDFAQVIRGMAHALFQSGKSFRQRAHDAYAKVPPPWL